MNNKDKSSIEDFALAAGCLVISYGFVRMFELPKFLFICIFATLYIFLFSSKQKSKKKKQEELLKQQLEIRKKYLEKQKRIENELKEKENQILVEEQQEIEKEYEPHPNQISLFDVKKYEANKEIKEKIEVSKNQQQKKKTQQKEVKSNEIEKKLEEPKKEDNIMVPINKSNLYIFEYDNENEFRKLERSLKKYNMIAYKKLFFEFYPDLKEGKFLGKLVSSNKKEKIEKYELELPTDRMFREVHDSIILHYTVYKKEKIIFLNKITPTDILLEGHKDELLHYKGVMISKSHPEKDMFKINLLNMINKD